MSPLGEAIYHILLRRVRLVNPLISYHELVKKLPGLDPPFDNITRNDDRLFRSLAELSKACQERGLPTLAALVIRSSEKSPGAGYYHASHPEVGDDPQKQIEVWEMELERIKMAAYPPMLGQDRTGRPDTSTEDRQWSRPLGHLRFASDGSRPTLIFAGSITCPRCSASVSVEVERNAGALSAKQPAFLLTDAGASQIGRPIGHLFIGTILSSPVLYYGSLNHCGTEQRLAIFYNRALRDRSDHHLTIMPSASTQTGATASEAEVFKLHE